MTRTSPFRCRCSHWVGRCVATLLLVCAGASWAQAPFPIGSSSGAQNRVRVDLIPEVTTVRPGEPFSAVLRMRLAPGWHTYWSNPGDSGLPTHLEWRLPQGVSADPPQWPVPKRLPVGPLMNYGYEQEVLLPVRINVPSGFAEPVLRVAAQAEWLVCREVCIPETAPVGFELPTAPQATSADPRWQAVFTAARNALPKALPGWTASANVADGQLRISLQAPAGASLPEGELYFYNGFEGQVVHAKPQIVTRFRDGVRIEVPLHGQPTTPVERMSGVLVSTGGFGPERIGAISIASLLAPELPGLGPRLDGALAADRSRGATNAIPGASALPDAGPAAGPGSGIGLALALLLAVAGGLILNLMPCVFPVLSIKALAMLDQSAREPRALRMDGLAFAAGVMVSFWALAGTLLALRAGGEQIGWGFQLQSPPFIAAMAVLFTLLALNLAGVFELGSSVASAAGGVRERSGRTGAFLTGVLAVAIAAPCTAPFMGAALGYALAQPAVVALAVFSALALGMALPYVLLSFAPGLARVLPRPGPWMVAFKQAMVFPLLGTVAWLTWVLGIQSGNNAVFGLLAGLVLVSFAAWIYGHFATRAAGRGARVSAGAFTVVFALAGMYVAWPSMDVVPAEQSTRNRIGALEWEPWSVERVEALRAEGRPVFIDFTAAWCVTCQVNKQLVLDTGAVVARLTERNVATLRADWTRRDRAITEALAGYGRSGVPVYALYLPGRAQPILLPELLTREIVLAALDRTDSDSVASTR